VLGSQAALIGAFAAGVSLFGKRGKLLRMSRLAGVPPRQTLVIGDEIRDLEAAKKAKMAFGAVSWGLTQGDALAARGADMVFRQMSDIPAAVMGQPVA
jgi:phosphoglycolate phosphatase